MTDDPLMAALIKKIPPPGSAWPLDQRALWISACEAAFNLIYGPVERIDIPSLFIRTSAPADEIDRLRSVLGAIVTIDEDREPVLSAAPVKPPTPEPLVESPKEGSTPPKGAGGARGSNRKLERPDGCPSNLDMAIAAVKELGPSSGNAIREYVRRKWWSDAPKGWSGCLYSFADSGKLAREGVNFALPGPLKGGTSRQIITDDLSPPKMTTPNAEIVIEPKTPPTPARPPAQKPAGANCSEFEWRGQTAVLPTREFRALQRLKPVINQGFLEFSAIVGAAFAGEQRPADAQAWCRDAEPIINAAVAVLGLKFKLVPKMGYSLQESI